MYDSRIYFSLSLFLSVASLSKSHSLCVKTKHIHTLTQWKPLMVLFFCDSFNFVNNRFCRWCVLRGKRDTKNQRAALSNQIGVESKRLSTSKLEYFNSSLYFIYWFRLWKFMGMCAQNCFSTVESLLCCWWFFYAVFAIVVVDAVVVGCYLHCESSYIISNQKLWLFVQLVNIEMTNFLALRSLWRSSCKPRTET